MKWFTVAICVPLIFSSGCNAVERAPEEKPDRFADRDGRAEALADEIAGRPIQLYGYLTDGIVPGMPTTVAILNCEATHYLPELFDRDGRQESASQRRSADSAFKFATEYNLTTFSERRGEIVARCPNATLATDQD